MSQGEAQKTLDPIGATRCFRWSNGDGTHGMATVAALEADGWRTVRDSVRYPGSWLMRKG